MIDTYCRAHHEPDGGSCAACTDLLDYAGRRLHRCVFGDRKPTCANCSVHCYSDQRRDEIRTVMRYAGPRMLRTHPLLAIAHIADGWRRVPHLPKARASRRNGASVD